MMWGIIVLLSIVIAVLLLILYIRWRQEKALMNRLKHMLEQAIAGSFTEGRLEENTASDLESELWRFINDCKISTDKQQEQKQRIQELISDISHQTVTSIANIKIYAELLEEAKNSRQEQEWNEDTDTELQAIRFQVDKLDFLIESLVKVSRLETGVITLNPRRCCIQEVLDALKEQFVNKAGQQGVILQIDMSEEMAEFDIKWTVEAIGNIVDNAIKYTPSGGRVSIHVMPYTLFLRVDICDTGIGIREADIAQIFTRFYRASEVRRQPGVGIGLYLARQIISMQKGYIKVASEPGQGSVFSVFLNRG